MTVYNVKQTNTSPKLQAALTDASGSAINLTGASVQFESTRLRSTSVDISGAGAIEGDPLLGIVSYTLSASDTAKDGTYRAQWAVVYADTSEETFPNEGFDTLYIEGDV